MLVVVVEGWMGLSFLRACVESDQNGGKGLPTHHIFIDSTFEYCTVD